MDGDVQRNLQYQLKDLKSTSTRFRLGEVTDDSPLSVTLGGSAVPYGGVSSLEAGLQVGDRIAALVFGNDMLVLGRLASSLSRLFGHVNSDGTVARGSGGFSVSKGGTGDYTVTFDEAFASTPVVLLGSGDTGAGVNPIAKLHPSTPPSASSFRVTTFRPSTEVAADGSFAFIVERAA